MAGGVRGQLAARRQAILAAKVITYRVPDWEDPQVFIRFRPLRHEEIRAALTRAEKSKNKAAGELDANVGLLVKACLEVWGDYGDGERTPLREDPDAGLTKFDGALAVALGLPADALASDVVKALFITEGDILSCAQYLGEQSGFREAEGDEELAGE